MTAAQSITSFQFTPGAATPTPIAQITPVNVTAQNMIICVVLESVGSVAQHFNEVISRRKMTDREKQVGTDLSTLLKRICDILTGHRIRSARRF